MACKGITLKRKSSTEAEPVNLKACIICQKVTRQTTTTTENGRKRVKSCTNT